MCDNYPVIPQYSGTCWFNSIITACCYSQGLREVFINNSLTWNNKNSFVKYFKTILKYAYTYDKRVLKYNTDHLLLKYLVSFDKKLETYMKQMIQYYYGNPKAVYGFITYIIKFLKNFNIKCLDFIKLDDKYLVDFDKNIKLEIKLDPIIETNYSYTLKESYKENKYEFKDIRFKVKEKLEKPDLTTIPDVIIINPNALNTYLFENNQLLPYATKKIKLINDDKYNNDFINYKGFNYKLDAVILCNYNMNETGGHAILGLTCGNNRYVYNSFIINKKCKLYKFKWNINEDKKFQFNYNKCKMEYKTNDKKNQVFSFNKGPRLLIYVKEKVDYFSISKKDELLDNFYDFENYSKRQLQTIVKNINKDYINKTKEELIEIAKEYIKK